MLGERVFQEKGQQVWNVQEKGSLVVEGLARRVREDYLKPVGIAKNFGFYFWGKEDMKRLEAGK